MMPSAARKKSSPRITLVRDPWGRERWGRTDAQGRLVEVVEPNPSGSGSVFEAGALLTTYAYNTLGNLIQVTQGAQTRSFKYDSLGRLLAQKLAEASARLNDAGGFQASGGTWSDVFTYDERSNLTSRTDARGVKTIYTYNNDPLNRLQSVSWNTNGFGDTANPILSAATVTYQYRTKSSAFELRDVTQPSGVTTAGISTESYGYDAEDRISSKTLMLTSRPSFPFVTDYTFDALDRITDVRYPAEYGNGTQPRRIMHHDYDVASRLTGLTVDGATHASQIVYNAASQTTSLKVGLSGANQITENYAYNSQTGLLDNQTVARGATTLLNLSYDYAGPNGKRTGQLTKILNNLNPNKDRGYNYDALGRLVQAKGGPSGSLWTQTYTYDRYGNRTTVSANGSLAKAGSAGILPAVSAQRERTKSEPEAVATGSSVAIAQPSDPQVPSPTDQLSTRTNIPLPESLRTDAPRSGSNSHHAARSAPANTATPQGPAVFTDDPLVPGVTIIKAVHITELRTAVNQARSLASLPAASWAETISQGVTLIKAAHIVELRARLDEARLALGLSAASYTDPTLTVGVTSVRAVHIQELRQRVTEALLSSSSTIPSDGHPNLSYDPATNRINSAGFAYDAAGNQVKALIAGGASQWFQYDAANRLVKVRTNNNQTVIASYTYGDSNERLILEEGGVRIYYACESSAEYVESGGSTTPTWSRSYIHLGARLLSSLTPNGSGGAFVQYHHPDRLGTRLVTNAQNTTYFEQQTLPFGTALNESPPAGGTIGTTNKRFTSYDRSANTGLDYAVNRHYDPQQGRFTQVDPIGMSSTSLASPQTLNLYAYCTNDPINHTDPSGLGFISFLKKVIKWVMVAVAVALIVIATLILATHLFRLL
jgi:RHS repeat-associated protein